MRDLTQIFKALSDETRLRILALLALGELCVCDLMAVLKAPQSTVSRHLATLRNAGLVEGRREGVWMYYCLKSQSAAVDTDSWGIITDMIGRNEQAVRDVAVLNNHLAHKDEASA